MAIAFADEREKARRRGERSFSFKGRKYSTVPPGKDVNDASSLRSSQIREMAPEEERPTAPQAAPAPSSAPASAAATNDLKITPERPQAATDRASGIRAERATEAPTERLGRSAGRSNPFPPVPAPERTSTTTKPATSAEDEPDGEELVADVRRTAEERQTAEANRREQAATEDASRRSKVDEEERDADEGESREFKRRFKPLPDKAGYSERLQRMKDIEAAQSSDRELQALDTAIKQATRANNTVLVTDLTTKRRTLLRQRYGERDLGERSLSVFQ